MKAVILAGGFGSRITEESHLKPKPMIQIGDYPILWHIMKMYSVCGINDFIVCLGYKGQVIKEYFSNYSLYRSQAVTIDLERQQLGIDSGTCEPWKLTLVETGPDTQTGGRLKRVKHLLDNETFCFTYGDGVSDIDISKLIEYHRLHGRKATLTAIQPPGRFGALELHGDSVSTFLEKPAGDGGWVNGGFFVLEPSVLDYIEDDQTHWERSPLEKLAEEKQLVAYKHSGFWQSLDTMRDRMRLEELWNKGNAPWKTWRD
ncbi:MAG: glucose-1-phosphate cytidylyltransferase [Oligoflexia bacterium]|nr:glucose-1-phosphate cytidylyltransferase [Oligoflexia bacterium]